MNSHPTESMDWKEDMKTRFFHGNDFDVSFEESLLEYISQLLSSQKEAMVREVEGMKGILWHDDVKEHTRRIHRHNTLDEVLAKITAL
jgi:hypothetical protein